MSNESALNFDKGFSIAIDGPAGSGKTILANLVAENFDVDPHTQVIHTDHFFEPAHYPGVDAVEGTPGGFNVARFMEQVGEPLNTPTAALSPYEYLWQSDSYEPLPEPLRNELIVVEGIKLIGLPVDWDLKIWINIPRDERKNRFLARRVENRRMPETDKEALLTRFNLWADDADEYEALINPHNREDVLVIGGDTPHEQQMKQIVEAIS